MWCRQIVNTTNNGRRLTRTGSSNDQRGRTRSGESITLLRGIEIRQRLHRGGSRSRNSSVRRQLMIQRGQSISHQQTQIDLREGVNILRKGCCQLGVNSGDLIKRDRIVVNVNQGLCQKRNRFVLVNIRCSSDETVVDISHSDLLMQAHPQGGQGRDLIVQIVLSGEEADHLIMIRIIHINNRLLGDELSDFRRSTRCLCEMHSHDRILTHRVNGLFQIRREALWWETRVIVSRKSTKLGSVKNVNTVWFLRSVLIELCRFDNGGRVRFNVIEKANRRTRRGKLKSSGKIRQRHTHPRDADGLLID